MGWGPKAPDMTGANAAAKSQAQIAMEQWAMTKEYMPKAMALADKENERADRLANAAEEDSTFYRGIARHQFDESKKAEPFQQRMRDMATEYDSGRVGDADAGRANADLEQAFTNASGSMSRDFARRGLNPGSAGFASAMGDMYTQKALAGAGAQTNARLGARQKAEQMVAMAAGSGQAAFGNGASAGGMTGSAAGGAMGYGSTGLGGLNSVQGTYNSGANGAATSYGNASAGLRANAIESAKNPGFDFIAGLATSGVKAWAGGKLG